MLEGLAKRYLARKGYRVFDARRVRIVRAASVNGPIEALATLAQAMADHGLPVYGRSDNGVTTAQAMVVTTEARISTAQNFQPTRAPMQEKLLQGRLRGRGPRVFRQPEAQAVPIFCLTEDQGFAPGEDFVFEPSNDGWTGRLSIGPRILEQGRPRQGSVLMIPNGNDFAYYQIETIEALEGHDFDCTVKFIPDREKKNVAAEAARISEAAHARAEEARPVNAASPQRTIDDLDIPPFLRRAAAADDQVQS